MGCAEYEGVAARHTMSQQRHDTRAGMRAGIRAPPARRASPVTTMIMVPSFVTTTPWKLEHVDDSSLCRKLGGGQSAVLAAAHPETPGGASIAIAQPSGGQRVGTPNEAPSGPENTTPRDGGDRTRPPVHRRVGCETRPFSAPSTPAGSGVRPAHSLHAERGTMWPGEHHPPGRGGIESARNERPPRDGGGSGGASPP